MVAMNLVDNLDNSTSYGILICNNENISEETIQNKIHEIKHDLYLAGEDWVVEDVIGYLPKEWLISLQNHYGKIEI